MSKIYKQNYYNPKGYTHQLLEIINSPHTYLWSVNRWGNAREDYR